MYVLKRRRLQVIDRYWKQLSKRASQLYTFIVHIYKEKIVI